MFPRARTPDGEIEGAGGAYVRRRLPFGDRVLVAGDRLTAEEVAGIPDINLRSLINLNVIELFPASPDLDKIEEEHKVKLGEKDEEIARLNALLEEATKPGEDEGESSVDVEALQAEITSLREQLEQRPPPPPVGNGDCFLMPAETGKGFHIIQGHQVTDKPISRAQATAKIRELTAP